MASIDVTIRIYPTATPDTYEVTLVAADPYSATLNIGTRGFTTGSSNNPPNDFLTYGDALTYFTTNKNTFAQGDVIDTINSNLGSSHTLGTVTIYEGAFSVYASQII